MIAPFVTLNANVSYDEIVGIAAEQVPEMPRIAPGDPGGSYLWRKINDTHAAVGGTGTAMPPAFTLEQVELETIEAWILAGAEP